MAEQLWRKCEKCDGQGEVVVGPGVPGLGRETRQCPSFDEVPNHLVPVAPSALLIEDGFDAAKDRTARWLLEYDGYDWGQADAFVKGNALLMAADMLCAAVGEGT